MTHASTSISNVEHAAVDLSKVAKAAEAHRKVEERAAFNAAMVQVAKWDDAMNRAFKGIISRPERHRRMRIAAERAEAVDA
jgi:hypothetical protein